MAYGVVETADKFRQRTPGVNAPQPTNMTVYFNILITYWY